MAAELLRCLAATGDPELAPRLMVAVRSADALLVVTHEGHEGIVFEAFDEPLKRSPDQSEPEKHWGLFRLDRTLKLVMQRHYPELLSRRAS